MKKRIPLYFVAGLFSMGIGATYFMATPSQRAVFAAYAGDIAEPVTPPFATTSQTRATDDWSASLIDAGRSQIGVTKYYDGAYVSLKYPMGDIDRKSGVCTDVVIRALRDAHDFDLQKQVHQDMTSHFASYPKNWGLKRPDKNIDHRRVPNLRRFFERKGWEIAISENPDDYAPGDIVSWMLAPGTPHIGIVSDEIDRATGVPKIIHNVGAGAREQNFLFAYPITGHFRNPS